MKRTILILTVLISIQGFSQGTKEKKTYQVYISDNEHGLTARAMVMKEKARLEPEEELTYTWYSAGKVQQTKGGFDGKLLSGPYTSFYLSGALMEKGVFREGLKNGKWSSWTIAGNLKETVSYKRGSKQGRYVLFNEEGKKVLEARYRKDKLHGKVEVFEAGKLIGVKKYKRGKEVVKQANRQTGNRQNVWKKLFKKKEKQPENTKKTNEKPKKNEITKS